MEKHAKKRWRGGIIYLREDGTIEKVVGRDGNEIKPDKESPTATGTPIVVMRGDDPEERCIYTAGGNCYCT